jgi:DNA-binding IclR family transcriptional regulator
MSNVGVLDKVMAILRAFLDTSASLQPPDVAARVGISPATAYRLMKSMAHHGLLEYGLDGYRLGITLVHLGARVVDGLDLNRLARPHLEWLRDQTSENAELHVRHGLTRVPIQVVVSQQNLRPMGQVGVPLPLHSGASAKVLLAWLPADERAALARMSHEAEYSDVPFDAGRWEQELALTRRQGWAASDGERESGVSAVASPVYGHEGSVVAALVVSGPTIRLGTAELRTRAVEAAVTAAQAVSLSAGHNPTSDSRRNA